jgi:hypothetical protein
MDDQIRDFLIKLIIQLVWIKTFYFFQIRYCRLPEFKIQKWDNECTVQYIKIITKLSFDLLPSLPRIFLIKCKFTFYWLHNRLMNYIIYHKMFKILINFAKILTQNYIERKHQTYPSSDFKCNIAHIERETLRLMDVVVACQLWFKSDCVFVSWCILTILMMNFGLLRPTLKFLQ